MNCELPSSSGGKNSKQVPATSAFTQRIDEELKKDGKGVPLRCTKNAIIGDNNSRDNVSSFSLNNSTDRK